jgi:short-subunit dehydrogenase
MKYAMTKHAIVGFSSSLRLEAERYGVRVGALCALCPAAVGTLMLTADNPADLPRVPWVLNMRRYLSAISRPIPVAQLTAEALRGVERNQALIIVPAQARLAAFLYRLAPALVQLSGRRALLVERKDRPANP